MIKNKVGSKHEKKEEEQRLEKERIKEETKRQEQEELRIKQLKEKEVLYNQLFGITETKKPASIEKAKNVESTADDALYKYIQEENVKRKAAEANGEFDR